MGTERPLLCYGVAHATDYLPADFALLPIHLFVATEDDDGQPRSEEGKKGVIDGWSQFGVVTMHEVPGSHTTMMYQPHVKLFTEEIKVCLK
ncbi:MAG: hypothetical protein AAF702_38570 [Chloroflexota bacterium]